jgi:hypothetical protein
MTKNQKIAAGCGGLGCLGLIVLAIAGALGYYLYTRPASGRSSPYNFNSNSNSNRVGNQNANESTNSAPSNSTNESSSYSDDDKHKLFQAASMTGDAELVQQVVKKLGLFKANGTPADDYPQFIKDHFTWGANNADFIGTLDTPDKARAYVDAHL